jgi:SAM-dependent methyltransferase
VVDETAEEREARRRRRALFDTVPERYEATRRGYPDELLELLVETAGLRIGSAVLEIGCGTGQLTRQLVPLGFDVTAIDIAPATIAAARRIVSSVRSRFVVSSFEDLDAPPHSFDLVVSATAFHWIDPEVAFVKAAALLRPGGWLAVLSTGEAYDDPFGSSLRSLWTGLNPRPDATPRPSDADAAMASGLFDSPVFRQHEYRLTLPADAVAGVERTRATFLDYTPEQRRRYDEGLDGLLRDLAEVSLSQRSSLLLVQARDITSA